MIGQLLNKLYILNRTLLTHNDNTFEDADNDELFANDVLLTTLEDTEPIFDFNLRRDIDLLHRRYAHVDVSTLLRMVRENAVDGLRIPAHVADPNRFHCESCRLAKATQLNRDPSLGLRRQFERVNKDLYFNVVWSDVLGPITPVALGNYKFGVTFTESNSRYRYFYPLKHKSDVLDAFKSLIAEVSSQGFTVRLLRSDNGGEYTSDAFKSFCRDKNIEHRTTPPNTPKANSVSERFNRVLTERARAVILGSKLPNFLWAYVMSAVTYIYNRTISPTHKSKSPYEVIFGARPNVAHLRAYGCIAYMYNFAASSKLDPRAIKGALVGYDNHSSAYLIYVPESNSVRRSGHVAFHEHQLLFTNESKTRADHNHILKSLREKTSVPKSSSSNTPLLSKKTAACIATAKRFASPPRDSTTTDQQSITSTTGLPNLSNVPLTTSPRPVSPLIVSSTAPTITSTSRTKRARHIHL